jgi:hypothetical protein
MTELPRGPDAAGARGRRKKVLSGHAATGSSTRQSGRTRCGGLARPAVPDAPPFEGRETGGRRGSLLLQAPLCDPQGAMSAAAYSPPADRTSDWLEELERILKEFDALPNHAQDAVSSVVNSLLHDPDTSDSEITHLNALIARHRPRSLLSGGVGGTVATENDTTHPGLDTGLQHLRRSA